MVAGGGIWTTYFRGSCCDSEPSCPGERYVHGLPASADGRITVGGRFDIDANGFPV